MATRSGGGGIPRREPCAKCGNPVYIAERLTVGKSLYHRTCFRCARCNSQLTLANYYETETPSQFCCETCPDEESNAQVGVTHNKDKSGDKSMLSRSLSDEEKSAGLKNLPSYQQHQQQDEYSAKFETALEESSILGSPMLESSESSKARTQFLAANLIDSTSDTEIPPELPKTKPPDIKSATNSVKTSPTFSSSERRERPNSFSGNSVNKALNESKDNSGSLYLSSRSPNLHARTSSGNISSSEQNKTSFSNVNQLSTTSPVAKSKSNVTKDKAQPQNESNVQKEDDVSSLVKNRMKLFQKADVKEAKSELAKSPQDEEENVSTRRNMENLKRPLADTSVTSPEKKFSLEKPAFQKPPSSPSHNRNRAAAAAALEIRDSSAKSNREIAQSHTKSLTFLLQKQIDLKEGKISPKSLIDQAKAESSEKAKSVENVTLNNETNIAKDRLRFGKIRRDNEQIEKRKSSENLLTKPKAVSAKPAIVERKRIPDESPKSLLPPNRRNSTEENKNKTFSMRKIETPSERISNGNKNLSNIKIGNQPGKITLGKISPEKERPTSLNITKPNLNITNPHPLKKQQSMEDIPKTRLEANRVSLSRHWKDGRKENNFQSKYKSAEKLKDNFADKKTSNDYDSNRKNFTDYSPVTTRISSESLLKSVSLRHPDKLRNAITASTGSMGKLDYGKYRRDGSRMNMYVSDTELNNILNRRSNTDWSTSSYRKSMEYLPMRSIENIYRSNSEENIGYRSDGRPVRQQHEPSTKNSVSALKNKFECLSVVESRPTSCQSDHTTPTDNTDIRNNSVVSEIQPEKPHGEILRDGHIITTSTPKKMEGRDRISISDSAEDTSLHRSDADGSSEVILVVDLTESGSPKPEDNLSRSNVDVLTISDDSVIEISDSGISEKLDVSGITEADKRPDDSEYPDDLNPFGDEDQVEDNRHNYNTTSLNTKSKNLNDSLNPFGDDEDEDGNLEVTHEPKTQQKITPRRKIIVPLDHAGDTPEYVGHVIAQRISVNPFEDEEEDNANKAASKPTPAVRKKLIIPREEEYKRDNEKNSTNPFGDDEDEEEDVIFRNKETGVRPIPTTMPQKKLIPAPNISLNPFWSDADEDGPEYDDDDYDNKERPVPKPRKSRNTAGIGALPEPKLRTSNQLAAAVSFGSNSSLSSCQSGSQSVRKKKPAPRPPIFVTEAKTESPPESSLTSSPSTSVSHSPRLAAKARKTKKAPLPPPSSTPLLKSDNKIFSNDVSPIPTVDADKAVHLEVQDSKPVDHDEDWDNEKDAKDKVNENRRSQLCNLPPSLPIPGSTEYQDYVPNKSMFGKWKRKKGPAPSRPVPQMRMIKELPVSEFRKELDLIELQKQGLEKQGVRLERIIRDRCEGPNRDESIVDGEDTVPIEVEDLILQLFEVVNEKNELSRREAELMYLQRQQRLEEEHAEVEYQIRCLMMQPEVNKTDSDKAKEEELIQRLVDIVERRNEIIECLEMDRLREAEEDDSITTSLNSYASRRDEQSAGGSPSHVPKLVVEQDKPEETSEKKSKKTKKDKKSKSKKSQVIDDDKDVDESETSSIVSVKDKKKKKFSLF